MEMTKQTAVEWLLEQIEEMYIHRLYDKEIDQALAMEKEHIIEAFHEGQWAVVTFEEYYNKTFRGVDD
jgi:hypothetical protein